MIFHSSAMVEPCRLRLRPICVASNSKFNPEQLRFQLDELHAEAETTRAKANSARLRLMRLSEAAEKLKRQAAISVHSGKENEARELLFQKKKVTQAMERSKSRIELLNELSAKLNEAISLKETQLIGNIARDLEVDREDVSGPVRIVSSTLGVIDDADEDKDCSFAPKDSFSKANITVVDDCNEDKDEEANAPVNDVLGSLSETVCNGDSIVTDLNTSSFDKFLENLDLQLNRIEAELVAILNVSALILNDKEKPKNSKVQLTLELLESIHAIRQRIGRIMQKKVEIM